MSELVIDGVKFRQSGLNNIVLLHGKHKLSIAQHVSPLMKKMIVYLNEKD